MEGIAPRCVAVNPLEGAAVCRDSSTLLSGHSHKPATRPAAVAAPAPTQLARRAGTADSRAGGRAPSAPPVKLTASAPPPRRAASARGWGRRESPLGRTEEAPLQPAQTGQTRAPTRATELFAHRTAARPTCAIEADMGAEPDREPLSVLWQLEARLEQQHRAIVAHMPDDAADRLVAAISRPLGCATRPHPSRLHLGIPTRLVHGAHGLLVVPLVPAQPARRMPPANVQVLALERDLWVVDRRQRQASDHDRTARRVRKVDLRSGSPRLAIVSPRYMRPRRATVAPSESRPRQTAKRTAPPTPVLSAMATCSLNRSIT